MKFRPLLVFNLFVVTLISACNIKTDDNLHKQAKKKELQMNRQPPFIADQNAIHLKPIILLLEKEQEMILSIKNQCLIANIPDTKKDFLFIFNKNQTAIYDSNHQIIGVRDNKSKKEILLNTSFGVAGLALANDSIQYKLNKPTQCPDNTIIVGDFL